MMQTGVYMKDKVTIQDLADALGMSRNTVSKALNGQHVPLKTRNAVLNAAIEMGYKEYKLAAASERGTLLQKRIVLLSSRMLLNMNYYMHVLHGIEEAMLDHDMELIQFNVTNPGSFAKFKNYILNNKVDGIVCIEFWDSAYVTNLIEIGIPLVFLDFPLMTTPLAGNFDVILPESRHAVMDFCIQQLQTRACRTFGFVGDYQHCLSFFERFSGMQEAMVLSGIPVDMSYSITYSDAKVYSPENLQEALQALPALPDCFICANDYIALSLVAALKAQHIGVPKEVKVVGFDNIVDSRMIKPELTTFNVNKKELGRQTIAFLLNRIANPSQPNYTIHIASTLVLRASS